MKMKSIRLNFPAEGISLPDKQIIEALAEGLMIAKNEAYRQGSVHESKVLRAIERATLYATVDEYDDRTGSPVFYIP